MNVATYTSNYGLHQWAPEDNFLRTDFNEDLEKIDEALTNLQNIIGKKAELVCGYYVGDGTSSRFIDLGFEPAAVSLECCSGTRDGMYGYPWGGLGIRDFPSISVRRALRVSGEGFFVYKDDYLQTNSPDQYFVYMAFRIV